MRSIAIFLTIFLPGILFGQNIQPIENPNLQNIQPTGGSPAGVALLETNPSDPTGTKITYVTGLITVAAGAPDGSTATFPPFYYDSSGNIFYTHDGTTWRTAGDLSQSDIDTLAELNAVITDATLIDQADFFDHVGDQANPHSVNAAQAGAVPWHDAVVDPTVNDDEHPEGTIWRNNQGTTSEADDTFFQLLDDTSGAAVWVPMPRLTAAGVLEVSSLDVLGVLSAESLSLDGSISYKEQATPPDPVADEAIVFAQDNGVGKTQLMVQFPTGAAVQLAIEP